jgi:DNA-directed RNA polymerase specialized sigma24 family protein
MTATLRLARQAAQRLDRAVERETSRRDAAIREAALHHSLQEIADAVGLSKPRVHQIVRGAIT